MLNGSRFNPENLTITPPESFHTDGKTHKSLKRT